MSNPPGDEIELNVATDPKSDEVSIAIAEEENKEIIEHKLTIEEVCELYHTKVDLENPKKSLVCILLMFRVFHRKKQQKSWEEMGPTASLLPKSHPPSSKSSNTAHLSLIYS